MTDYRRNFLVGGSFFFTVNLAERRRQSLRTTSTSYAIGKRNAERNPCQLDPFNRRLGWRF
jgi:putative transposase